jgi:hypothetical protein
MYSTPTTPLSVSDMDLSNYTLIDTVTGTYLDPTSCVLVPDEAATPLWLGDETDLSDSEICEIGKQYGKPLTLNDQLAESIADALWGEDADKEWNADTLDSIADAIRTLRPDLARG